jgi:hypothetical protein
VVEIPSCDCLASSRKGPALWSITQLSVNFAESKCNSFYIHQEPKITGFNATLANLVMRVFIIYEATNSFFISLLHPSTNINDQIRLKS